MKASSRSVILAVAALLIAAAVLGPAIKQYLVRGQLSDALSDARQLQIAIQMRVNDGKSSGEFSDGALPADLGVQSAREYFERIRLVENNYLSATDFKKLWGSGKLAIANVASSDPPDTAWIVSGAQARMGSHGRDGLAVVRLGGSGGIFSRPTDARNPDALRLPDRQPPILPAE